MNTEQKVVQVRLEDIIPNRFQPRLAFDEDGLKELSESIKQHGIIQPLVLRKLGNKYEIIAGERRYKAATMAGLQTVPCIISNIDDNQSAEIALVENIQRRNLTPIEEAKSYKNLLDRGYLTQTELADKMGVSQSSIANKLRLLNLADEVQEALLQEKISERHARSLLALPKDEQIEWLKKILSKRLTVRQLDLEIKKAKGDGWQDIPLVKENNDINKVIENAQDIKPISSSPIVTEEKKDESSFNIGSLKENTTGKFFNFLEDEAADMNMLNNFNNSNNISESKDIEVLDDFEEKLTSDEEREQEKMNNNIIEDMNNIEEIKEEMPENIIDPMDNAIKLDPNYVEKQIEEEGLDLKTAINEIRDFVNKMNEKGFEMNLDEIDLDNTYQMTINIKKKDAEI